MDFSTLKAITIPEGDVVKVEVGGVTIWELPATYKNWVKYSTESDGATIYNGGLGYKTGYRIRSGGAETGSNASCTITGFIPVKGGDTIRVAGADFSIQTTSNAINVSDSSFTNLGQIVSNMPSSGYGIFASTYASYSFSSIVEESEGVYKWIVPPSDSGIAYIRVTGEVADISQFIITVNEEIS